MKPSSGVSEDSYSVLKHNNKQILKKISKIISVIIKLFHSGTAIRSFSDIQNSNENSAILPSVTN